MQWDHGQPPTIIQAAEWLVANAPARSELDGVELFTVSNDRESPLAVARVVDMYHRALQRNQKRATSMVAFGTKIPAALFDKLEPNWKGKQSKGEWQRNMWIRIAETGPAIAHFERMFRVALEEQVRSNYVIEMLVHNWAAGKPATVQTTKDILAAAKREKSRLSDEAIGATE